MERNTLWHDKVIFWALVAIVFLVPLAMNPYSLANFEPIKLTILKIFAAFILAIWIAKTIETGKVEIKLSPLYLPIVLLLVLGVIATISSINHNLSLFGKLYRYDGLVTLLLYVFVYYTTLNFVNKTKQLKILLGGLFASSIIIGGYGIAQHFGFDFMAWNKNMDVTRSFSTFGNAVFFGSYITLVLPLALIALLPKRNVLLKSLASLSFALLLANLVFSFTRAAWLGFGISIILMFIFIFRKIRKNIAALIIIAVLIAAVVLTIALPSPGQISGRSSRTVSDRLEETAQPGGTVRSRIYAWGVALDAIKDKPLTGFGPDTFEYIYLKYRDSF